VCGVPGDRGEIGRLDASAKCGQDMGGDDRSPAMGKSQRGSRWSLACHIRRRPSCTSLGTGTTVPCCPCRRTRRTPLGLCRWRDGKSSGLADPQAATVNQAETAAVYRMADRGENGAALRHGKVCGSRLCLEAGSFFKQRPVLAQRVR